MIYHTAINYPFLALPQDLSPRINRSQWVPFGLLFVGYFLAAYFGSYLYAHGHTFPGLIWPAGAVGTAGLFLGGRRLWPAIALAALSADLATGVPFFSSILLTIGRVLGALATVWLLQWLDFDTLFGRLRDALSLFIAALVPTIIVPTTAALVQVYIDHSITLAQFGNVWGPLWMGHIFAMAVLFPFLVRWISYPIVRRTLREWIEIVAAFSVLIGTDILLFWGGPADIEGVSLIYFLLVPFFWIALRIGPRFITLAVLVNAGVEILGVMSVLKPEVVGIGLLQTEIFATIVALIFFVLVTVIEERKEAAKALAQEIEKLEKALEKIRYQDESKNHFIAVLAHELRNPLAPIVSSLELIQMEKGAGNTERWLSVISDHTRTIRRLLDDLLDVSRITSRKLRLEKQEVDLAGVLRMSLQTAEPLFKSKDHNVIVEISEGSFILTADPVRLQQVVVNLLNNAARYTEPAGTITVRLYRQGGSALVSVKDTGIGIPAHLLSRIFEPFVQATSQKAGFAGLGIGLALTKQLVEMHGGTIEAKSGGPGEGSEFIVRLPMKSRVGGVVHLPTLPRERKFLPASRSRKVLIVDDNEAAGSGLEKLLTYRGHRARFVQSGSAAVAATVEFEPEVVLLDIGLPDISGYEVARRLKEEVHSSALLVALTGYGQEDVRERTRNAGFAHHLVKPVGLNDVEAIFESIHASS